MIPVLHLMDICLRMTDESYNRNGLPRRSLTGWTNTVLWDYNIWLVFRDVSILYPKIINSWIMYEWFERCFQMLTMDHWRQVNQKYIIKNDAMYWKSHLGRRRLRRSPGVHPEKKLFAPNKFLLNNDSFKSQPKTVLGLILKWIKMYFEKGKFIFICINYSKFTKKNGKNTWTSQ